MSNLFLIFRELSVGRNNKKSSLLSCISAFALVCCVCAGGGPLVETPLGALNGFYLKTRQGRTISGFTSVPYAVPPVGKLRFKAAVPIEKWSKTLNATAASPACVQRNPYTRQQEIVGQEDCLYVNIYTPYTDQDVAGSHAPLPVMVFIHGGGWMCGDSSTAMYGPAYLLDRDVLLVGINYRLDAERRDFLTRWLAGRAIGRPAKIRVAKSSYQLRHIQLFFSNNEENEALRVFVFQKKGHPFRACLRNIFLIMLGKDVLTGPLGFLSTQDEHCPGNNGLKDQQEALRFIQKVIPSFGGDKNSVTIFGESAGGASAGFHMLSKTSRGLFHKVISESGVALVPWAEAPPGEALRQAFRLAKYLDCPQAPSEKLIDCLRTKDSKEIIDTEFRFYAWDYEPMTPFKAVVEPDLPGAFLTTPARAVRDFPSVPWMTGLNSAEGCLKSVWITSNETRYQEFKYGYDTIAPITFYYENSPFADEINKKVKAQYLDGKNEEGYKQGLLDIYTDSYFAYPAVESIEYVMSYSNSPVYLYELTYRANNSFSQIFGDPVGDYGVCHADELMHLFPIDFLKNKVSDEDKEISQLIVNLWTNFATTGNPNKPVTQSFNWAPASSSKSLEYLDISAEPTMRSQLALRSRFWGSLPLWHNLRSRQRADEL